MAACSKEDLASIPAPDATSDDDTSVRLDAGTSGADAGRLDASALADASLADAPLGDAEPVCTALCNAAPQGDDSNPGTDARPFRSIARCALAVHAAGGGECIVWAGTYRETARVFSNTTVRARVVGDQRDAVVISGLDDFSAGLSWIAQGPNIWVAPVDLDRGASRLSEEDPQVFLDGTPLVEARWPNVDGILQLLERGTPRNAITQAGSAMADGLHGHLVDPSLPNMPLSGAVVHVAGGLNWGAHTGIVTHSSAGALDYLVDNGDPSPIMDTLRTVPGNDYYIARALPLLDHASEFYYDAAGKRLYLWLAAGDQPSRHRLEVKMREWAFDLSGAEDAKLADLKIWAASVRMDTSSADNELSGLDVSYVSHYLRNVGGPFAGRWNTTGIQLWGTHHTLRDSVIRYSAGNGISMVGTGHTVSNSIVYFTDYAGVYNASIFITSDASGYTAGHRIIGNTLRMTGRDSILFLATATRDNNWAGGAFSSSRIAFNDISEYGRLAVDLGGLYVCCNVDGASWQNGQVVSRSTLDHNAVHDGQGSGFFFDNMSHGFVVTHNLFWNNATSGVQMNGYPVQGSEGSNYDITINNNTFGPGQATSIAVQAQAGGGLSNTFVSNNIFVTPPEVRTGCATGVCTGQTDFNSGGYANYYGDPGFVHGDASPFDFSLAGGANPCSGTATAIWTDDAPELDRCPGGMSCGTPVAPSFGALNTGGYVWAYGSTRQP